MQKIHLIACGRCGQVHPWGQCPAKKEPLSRHRKSGPRTDIQRFRSSALWQHKAEEIKKRDKYLCRMCLDEGHINNKKLSVHHIIPIAEAEEKCLDNNNLITLCEAHHQLVEGNSSYRGYLATLTSPPGGLKAKI